jgi:hypothetical protein
MATTAQTTKTETTTKAPKAPKVQVSLTERTKAQLNQAVLKGKITVDDLSDLEQHVRKLAGFLGAA